MALDRQKILNELGSVMNQLKSTDCGCMGKLFGDSGQNVAQTGNVSTCGRYTQGCCHGHQYGCSSKPYNTQNFHRSCMGQCNPPKLYADTYNYLNENLMQPTVNEVYNDLKDITPANTIMNNPVAKQLCLSNDNYLAQPTTSGMPTFQTDKHNIVGTLNTDHNIATTNNLNYNNMGHIGGMGPQIMNMFGENRSSKSSNMLQQSKTASLPTTNQNNYNENGAFGGQALYNNQLMQQPTQQSKDLSMNPNAGLTQQMTPNIHNHHGQHAQGIAKFNEMFPGVMKNGDLGFDPMTIAIQMNPANQKQVALDTIHKMMNNNNGISTSLKNNDNSGHIVSTNNNNQYTQQKPMQGNVLANEILPSNISNQPITSQMLSQQQINNNTAQLNNQQISSHQPVSQQSNPYGAYLGETNQNAYAAVINTPMVNQLQQPLQYQQPITDPNTGNAIAQAILPTAYEGSSKPNTLQNVPEIPNAQQIIKEPLLPADTSKFVMPKQKYYEYNTLGQPVEMLPAKMYHTPEPSLPQTLSPQFTMKPKNDFLKYSNVKSTISKTSLMNNNPVGKTPSRNQLQNIYNQYKGSQSYTHQNIKDQFNKDISHSDGRLNEPRVNLTSPQMPIKNVGGDTAANNQLNDERTHKMEHVIGQIGDAPIIKQTGNIAEKLSPAVNRKYRNGLQDMVYTSYPTSAAWSFHGHGRAAPYSAGYRYRNKI